MLAATAVLVAALTGNTLAQHLGEHALPPAPPAAGAADPASPVHDHHGGQDVLHLLGACLAVLALGVALLAAHRRRSGRGDAPRLLLDPPAAARPPPGDWVPPPPSPPSLSPVIRT